MVRNPRIPLAPENEAKWVEFVTRVVATLRAAPYHLEYFQIWNEAHPGSGFWNADLDTYMKTIHLPAAAAIKALGGKVVYGGFPCCGTVEQLSKLLTKHRAWATLDVIAIHYFPEWCMDYLRRHAAENGNEQIGVWQTEIGFHRNYTYIATCYPTVLYWALTHDFADADRYKLFWFALGSPDDPQAYGYMKNLCVGKKLTPHGVALKTLADLFGAAPLAAYGEVKTAPALPFALKDDRLAAFRYRNADDENEILVAPIFTGAALKQHEAEGRESIEIVLPEIAPEKIIAVERVGIFGEREDVTAQLTAAENGAAVTVSLREKAKFTDANDNDNLRRPTFYTRFRWRD
jgi:hypothetical protein